MSDKVLLPTQLGLGAGIACSARRYFVDRFYTSHSEIFSLAESILDVGGTRDKKRGQFDISRYSQNVTTLNIDDGNGADIVCDASSMPVEDSKFDVIICAEVLEHVKEPDLVLQEIARVCKPGGRVFLTAPFLFPIHADPHDFRRYTASCWEQMLEKVGLELADIEMHGNFYTVFVDMIRMWIYKKVRSRIIRYSLYILLRPFITLSILSSKRANDKFVGSFTTGYGVVARKPSSAEKSPLSCSAPKVEMCPPL